MMEIFAAAGMCYHSRKGAFRAAPQGRTDMIVRIVLTVLAVMIFAAPALAEPENMGGKSGTWQETYQGSGVFVHQNRDDHWKAWDYNGGKMFTQPGKAEGKADERSVVQPDFHNGTQVYPGRNGK